MKAGGWIGLFAAASLWAGMATPALAGAGVSAVLRPASVSISGLELPAQPIYPFRPGPIPTPPALQIRGQSYSANWGGFIDGAAVSGQGLSPVGVSFDAVAATWTVPALASSPPNSFVAMWAGIGGVFGTGGLLQAGVIETFQGPQPQYIAFVEDYPNPALAVVMPGGQLEPIRAGDQMTVTVAERGDTWTVDLGDASEGWNTGALDVAGSYASAGDGFLVPDQGSAEWVVEDPSCGESLCSFANFSPAAFSAAQDTATTATTRSPVESIIVNAQGTPQVAISPPGIGTVSTATAGYAPFTVTRLVPGTPAGPSPGAPQPGGPSGPGGPPPGGPGGPGGGPGR